MEAANTATLGRRCCNCIRDSHCIDYRKLLVWLGLDRYNGGESNITITSTSKGITTAKELQPAKTLWDWLNLLGVLAIPVVVGLGAVWYTAQQGKVSDRENTDNQRDGKLTEGWTDFARKGGNLI
jgi:hypothetical protein